MVHNIKFFNTFILLLLFYTDQNIFDYALWKLFRNYHLSSYIKFIRKFIM